MEKFIIEGGIPLNGQVTPSGNKNAALPILAATLLTDEPVILHNLPDIRDVRDMRQLVASLGVKMEDLGNNSWRITARTVRPADLDPDLCARIRASILLAGPMLARTCEVHLPPPGGDVIGRRRVDTHLLALKALGADVHYRRSFDFKAKHLKGANILLDEASVTGTENVIMAAVTAKGTTVIRNAASEPHVQELCQMLNILGADITGIGSNTLTIDGVEKLHGGEFTIGPDYLEVISFVGAAVVTRGEVRICKASPQYLDMVRIVFHRLGVDWNVDGEDIVVPSKQRLKVETDLGGAIPEIKTNIRLQGGNEMEPRRINKLNRVESLRLALRGSKDFRRRDHDPFPIKFYAGCHLSKKRPPVLMPKSEILRKERISENVSYQEWLAEFPKRHVRDGDAKQPHAPLGSWLKSSLVHVRIANILVH